jgi:aldehyde dehydrogenase (NAD+)
MPQRFQNYIGGVWVDPTTEKFVASTNPADSSDVIGEFPASGGSDVQKAAEAAHAASEGWKKTSAVARGAYLMKAAAWLQSRSEEWAQAMTRENGKAIVEARGEVARCIAILQYNAVEGMHAVGEVVPSANANVLLYTQRVPLGVVGMITPWNFPLAIPLWKMAPALVYGNTIVLKPATATPHMGVLIAKLWEAVDLPKGVFNLVMGPGGEVGNAIVTHPRTRAVSFTGSGAVGHGIAVECARRNKKYQLEMGGKNPVIVMPDADLNQAAEITVSGAMKYAGQKCTATSRAIVVGGVLKEFTDLVVKKVNALNVGPGADPANVVVPVIDDRSRQNILAAIKKGQEQSGRVIAGGAVPKGAVYDKGFFVQPTVVDGVKPDAYIACEEIFGPVLSIIPAKDADEAIGIANQVVYGLSAGIFTRNLNSVLDFASRIEAGIVKINGETAGVEPQVPFGGMKDSSSGSREQGRAALEFFTDTKTVYVDRSAT